MSVELSETEQTLLSSVLTVLQEAIATGTDPTATSVVQQPLEARIFVVGGWVRDKVHPKILQHSSPYKLMKGEANDLDLVVHGLSLDTLHTMLSQYMENRQLSHLIQGFLSFLVHDSFVQLFILGKGCNSGRKTLKKES